ncbi:MAG: SprT-like domain-containing protein [Elusimicrobiota bacterium]
MISSIERNKSILAKYIPEQAVDTITNWIYKYNFKLKIKKSRNSKEGDYTAPRNGLNHRITVNHDLNKYSFLITLVHEIAHLATWEKHKGKVKPHGTEWKMEFNELMNIFLSEEKNVFPHDIDIAIHRYMQNPSAASCTDLHLSRILKTYNKISNHFLEQIPEGTNFIIVHKNKRHETQVFKKGSKQKKRFHCVELRTGKKYMIHPLCEVITV